tara:strand:+ start:365 stop:475 length:111 start_codon:yes stop_codon:yes gene_type:complete
MPIVMFPPTSHIKYVVSLTVVGKYPSDLVNTMSVSA